MTNSHTIVSVFMAFCAAALVSSLPSHAATLSDPTLAATLDPSGSVEININAANSTSKATMEGLSGFGVVQDFVGFTDGGPNVLSFADASRADVQISIAGTGALSSSGGALANAGFATSGTSAMRFASNNAITTAHTVVATIDFGTWNGSSFDGDAGPSVFAAGFTLSGGDTRFDRVSSITAVFLSSSGATLSTQTVTGPSGTGNQGLYFGYQATGGDSIGSVVLTLDIIAKTGGTQALFGFDDLGFTSTSTIPEPSTYAALMGVLIAALAVGRRIRDRR